MIAATVEGEVTEAVGIDPRTRAKAVVNREGVLALRKSEAGPGEHPFDRLLGILGPGRSSDEVMALTRGED
nr:hypothetical protein [uncultured Rhodopila sp.]